MAILAQEYPRFSDAEFARRHKAIAEVMAKADLDWRSKQSAANCSPPITP